MNYNVGDEILGCFVFLLGLSECQYCGPVWGPCIILINYIYISLLHHKYPHPFHGGLTGSGRFDFIGISFISFPSRIRGYHRTRIEVINWQNIRSGMDSQFQMDPNAVPRSVDRGPPGWGREVPSQL